MPIADLSGEHARLGRWRTRLAFANFVWGAQAPRLLVIAPRDHELSSTVFCLLSSVFCPLSSVFCLLSSVLFARIAGRIASEPRRRRIALIDNLKPRSLA